MSATLKTKPASRTKPSKKHHSKSTCTAYSLLLSAAKQATQRYETDTHDKKSLATLAGFSNPQISTVRKTFAKLKKDGLLVESIGSMVRLTDAGSKAAGTVELPTNVECLENIKPKLHGLKAVDILNILSDGRGYSRVELASLLGIDMMISTFRKAIASVRKQNILEEFTDEGVKMVRLNDSVFPEGRPT